MFQEIFADSRPQDRPVLSFELFPPKTEAGVAKLWDHVAQLLEFGPEFITCTYGAGGSTRQRTLEIVEQVKQRYRLPVASHLTCVGSSVDELRSFLREADSRGIDAIVALRGDPPQGEQSFQPAPGGLRYANELVALIEAEFPGFGIAVAGYPETHQEAPSADADLQNLKRKVESGGDVVITQLFFDNRDFFAFRDRCQAAGIDAPIVPGILPVTNYAQIQRISSMCGARLPEDFVSEMTRSDDPQWQTETGVRFARQQVAELAESGVPGIHFYVLNKSSAAAAVLSATIC